MAAEKVEGLSYDGWLPVNNPSLVSVDNPPIPKPVTQEEINRDWVSRPLNPWQQSNFILDRQQEGGFLLPLQLSPRNIALGGIVLSLIVTAVIGQILCSSHQIFLVKITKYQLKWKVASV